MRRSQPHSSRCVAIEAEGLQREYKGGLKAVDGIDLAVAPGEVYGFLGPNGAGKTTTVRMLVTLLLPTGGVARVAGFDVAREPQEVRKRIGVALQEAALDMLMSGRELMELQATLHGIPAAKVAGAPTTSSAASASARPRSAASARTRAACGAGSTWPWRSIHEPRGPLPRRAHHRPGPRQPPDAVGGGPPPEGRGHDGLPDDAVPRGGRPARRPRRRSSAPGKIVAEGTPEELKAQVGIPHLDITFIDPGDLEADLERAKEVLTQFGDHRPASEGCHVSIGLPGGARDVAAVVRALDDAGLKVASLDLVQPTLDDVFVEKTGRHLEGAQQDGAAPVAQPQPDAAATP